MKFTMSKLAVCAAIGLVLPLVAQAQIPRTDSVAGAKLYIAEPANGASIK